MINSDFFKSFFVILVIPNVVVMSLERILDQYIIDSTNFILSCFFAFEMIIKGTALGLKGLIFFLNKNT